MTERFEVGEVAIYVRPGSPYYGQEVTIAGPLEWAIGGGFDHVTGGTAFAGYQYEIRGIPSRDSRSPFCALPEWLRKKKPPALDKECYRVTSWDKCDWQPKVGEAVA